MACVAFRMRQAMVVRRVAAALAAPNLQTEVLLRARRLSRSPRRPTKMWRTDGEMRRVRSWGTAVVDGGASSMQMRRQSDLAWMCI